MQVDDERDLKNRIGSFIHHSLVSLVVAMLILLSVTLVMVHLGLPDDHPVQDPIETAQWVITALFVIELSLKCYVAPSRANFFGQYWIDILATLPWTQSLRVLRVLRLLRVFRVAVILSRRVRFVSALFGRAFGVYVVLGLNLLGLVGVGTFALTVSVSRARQRARAAELSALYGEVLALQRRALRRLPDMEPPPPPDAEVSEEVLRQRLEALDARLAREPGRDQDRELLALEHTVEKLTSRLPQPAGGEQDLGTIENSFWATLFFLVATEPMIDVPKTTVGRAIVLAVMFGGLTTFAIFTGIVTALMVNRLKRRMEIDDMDRFTLNGHIVICGWNRLVPLIISEIIGTPGHGETAIVVVADIEEPPPEVSQGGTGRVFFVRGDYTKPAVLESARVRFADRAIVVADTTIHRGDQDRDARTVLAALMIERMNPQIYTCAELLNVDNEPHLRAAGIEEVVVTTEAGGHHLALATLHFGLANVLNELMSGKIGDTLRKWPVPGEYVGLGFLEVVQRCKRERDALVVGIEVHGQRGPRSEGYAMRLNPEPDLRVGETDNLVFIGRQATL
ncbi:MAG: ion transporter [Planctomycetota bacterium]